MTQDEITFNPVKDIVVPLNGTAGVRNATGVDPEFDGSSVNKLVII